MNSETDFKQNNFVFQLKGDLQHLKSRLQKGSVVNGRIIYRLEDDKYILRIFGYNMIMRSDQKYKNFEEIRLKVKQVFPILEFSEIAEFNSKVNSVCYVNDLDNKTNIIVY